ncbi:MAG: hypothetical protein IPF96_01340 [Rhodobacter sp.]|nr:hypothetical protein [Rhodobacter sp.]
MFEIAFPLSLLAFAHSLQSIWRGHVVAIPLAILSAQTLAAALAWKMGFITTFAMTWSRGGQVEFGAINVAYFFATYLIVLAIYLLKRRHPAYHYSVASFTDLIRKRKENRFPLIALMLLAFSIYHFSILDLEVIFRNSQYILMSSPAVVVVKTPINIFVHAAQGLVGLIVIVYLSISIVNRRWGQVLILFPPAIWFLVFNITAHSRLAVVYAVFCITSFFVGQAISQRICTIIFCFRLFKSRQQFEWPWIKRSRAKRHIQLFRSII